MRKNGNSIADESALCACLEYLNARSRDPVALNPEIYSFDKAIVLIRLSDLARRRKSMNEANRLAKDADALCPSTRLRNCSANDLPATVRERDRQVWGN